MMGELARTHSSGVLTPSRCDSVDFSGLELCLAGLKLFGIPPPVQITSHCSVLKKILEYGNTNAITTAAARNSISSMTRLRSRHLAKDAGAFQQSTPPTHDEFPGDGDHLNSDDPMAKDETEVELEKLVFGDCTGFLEGLKAHRQAPARSDFEQLEVGEDADPDVEEDGGLEGIADADVKF